MHVVIDNPKDQFRIAVVRFTKTNTSGQTWVYITTLNGKKLVVYHAIFVRLANESKVFSYHSDSTYHESMYRLTDK